MQMVTLDAVGHVDIAIPREVYMSSAGFDMEVEHRVVVVWCKRTCLEATVEGQNAERELGLGILVESEILTAHIFGVQPTPHGVVVKARRAHADVVAHDIGVGTGIPA